MNMNIIIERDVFYGTASEGEIEKEQLIKLTPLTFVMKAKTINFDSISDGQKDIFYFITKVMSLPPLSVIIVDEPEIHLELAVADRLWTKLERARDDCLFIYLSHSLQFVLSRRDSQIIQLVDFEYPHKWLWKPIPSVRAIPLPLVLSITGQRCSKVLFVEGIYDFELYHEIYGDRFLVVNAGGGDNVIKYVSELRQAYNPKQFNVFSINAYGIIDRDFHDDSYFAANLPPSGGVFPLIDVSEVENFLCTEEVFKAVAIFRGYKDGVNQKWVDAGEKIKACFKRDLEYQIQGKNKEKPEPKNQLIANQLKHTLR